MDLERIQALIDAMAASDLQEMQISEAGWTLRLTRRGGAGDASNALPAATPRASVAAGRSRSAKAVPSANMPDVSAPKVSAPMFGVVYLSAGPNAPQFVSAGQHVATGAVLCIIEAMKVFSEVRADRDGVIAEVAVSSGEEVEAGQTLMRFA